MADIAEKVLIRAPLGKTGLRYIVYEARLVNTDDTITLGELTTIKTGKIYRVDNGNPITTSTSANIVTITEASLTNVNVVGIAIEGAVASTSSDQNAASYIIFKDETLYKAKNGSTGNIDYNESDADTVIDAVLADGGIGASLFFKNATYEIDTMVIENGFVSIIGESQNVIFKVTGSGKGIYVDNSGDAQGGACTFKKFVITPETGASADYGIYLHNSYRNHFEQVAVGYTDRVNQGITQKQQFSEAGVYVDGENNLGAEGNLFLNCEVRGNVKYGYYFTHLASFNQIKGGYVGGGWYNGGGWATGIRYPTQYGVYDCGHRNSYDSVQVHVCETGMKFLPNYGDALLSGVNLECCKDHYIDVSTVPAQPATLEHIYWWSPADLPPPTTPINDNPTITKILRIGTPETDYMPYPSFNTYTLGLAYKQIISGTWIPAISYSYILNYQMIVASPAVGNELQYEFFSKAGTFTFCLLCRNLVNAGIVTIYVDGVSQGTIDLYNATMLEAQVETLSVNILTNGYHTLNIKVTDKNASATSPYYYAPIHAWWLRT